MSVCLSVCVSVCLCVCLSVCKKTSVEHGDSKKKLIIIPKFVRIVLTDAGVRIVRTRTNSEEITPTSL